MEENTETNLAEGSLFLRFLPLNRKELGKNFSKDLLLKSLGFILIYYLSVGIILYIIAKYYSLEAIFWIIFGGNLFIALITQISHFLIDKNDNYNDVEKFIFVRFWDDCFIRCSAGVIEMAFYTISLAISAEFLIAGYLIMKSVSIWQSKEKPEKEGRHTAVHRTAVVLSLLFSLVAAYFLFRYLQQFTIFDLNHHFLFSLAK